MSRGQYIVIANDKTEIVQNKTHIAYALSNKDGVIVETRLNSKSDISKYIHKNII